MERHVSGMGGDKHSERSSANPAIMRDLSSPRTFARRSVADGFLVVLMLAGIGGAGLAAVLPEPVGPGHDRIVLVIAPPWGGGAAGMVRAAGGTPIGPVDAAFGSLVRFDGPVPVGALHDLGAWSLRDGTAVAAFCGVV